MTPSRHCVPRWNLVAGGDPRRQQAAESIHPYLGWVMNPQVNPGTDFLHRHIPVNSLGFDDFEHGIPKRVPIG